MILPQIFRQYDCFYDAERFFKVDLPKIKERLIADYSKKLAANKFRNMHFNHTKYVRECIKEQNSILGAALVKFALEQYATNPTNFSEKIFKDIEAIYSYKQLGGELQYIFQEAVTESCTEEELLTKVVLIFSNLSNDLKNFTSSFCENDFDDELDENDTNSLKDIISEKYIEKAEETVNQVKNVASAAFKSAKPAAKEFYKTFKKFLKKDSYDDFDK